MLCASLRELPARLGESGVVGAAVVAAASSNDSADRAVICVGDDEIGSVLRFDGGAHEPWSHLGALHPELSLSAVLLARQGFFKRWSGGGEPGFALPCGMTTIQSLCRIAGTTHDLIGHLWNCKDSARRGAFTMRPLADAADEIGADRSLWAANAKTQKRLVAAPTHKGMPHAGATDADRDRVREKMGTLHYARNMRWTSQSLLAARTERRVHGGTGWTALHHDDSRVLCALSLWFNSTAGFLVHWSQASRQHPGRGRTQVNAIKSMPCPNAEKLTKTQLRKASKWFDEIKHLELMPARDAAKDPVRKIIDEAVADVFGLPAAAAELIDDWRRLWVMEPTVKGE